MKLRPRDVISHQGRDHTVEAVLTYKLDGRTFRLARAVDDDVVVFIELTTDDMDDRVLLLREVRDLALSTPPPATVSYKGASYLPRFEGKASLAVDGNAVDSTGARTGTSCEVWRYRAAGDIFLHIERWPDRTVFLHGESVHSAMVEIFPAP